MAETLKERKLPHLRILGIAFLVEWLGPALIWIITGSVSAVFFALSIGNALLGLVLLVFCLPLGGLVDQVQRAMPHLAFFGKVMDLVIRHAFLFFGWPQSRRTWSMTLVFLSVVFFVASVSAFFCATGNMQADQALMGWIEHAFQSFSRALHHLWP
jgi:hypothetical protein